MMSPTVMPLGKPIFPRAWRGRAGTSQRTGASSEGWEKGLLGCARSMTRRRQARTLDRPPPEIGPSLPHELQDKNMPDASLGESSASIRRRRVARYLHTESGARSEEHTSELQSLMRSSYAVFC